MNATETKRLKWVWADMLSRCRNPAHKAFKNYGGRGVTVCAEWNDFASFLSDMDPRPLGGLLDRKDNNGPYSKDNCQWATRKQQNSNRRSCIYLDDNGERVTLKEYCRRRDLKYRPIVKRIQDRGWSLIDALTIPVGFRNNSKQRESA